MAVDDIQFTNNGSTTITNNPLGNNPGTDTTINLTNGSAFPAVTAPAYAFATLQDSTGTYEIVKITAHTAAATSMTVVRAQDNTSINTWPNGTLIEMRPNAAIFEVFRDHDHDTQYSAIGHDHAATYVDVSGDTMTGDLNLVTPGATDDSTKAASTEWINTNYNFYDLGGGYPGGVLPNSTVFSYIFPRSVTFFTAGAHRAENKAPGPTGQVIINIKRDGVDVGDITFNTSATSVTPTWDANTTFTAGQVLTLVTPADTHDMEDLVFTFIGEINF